MSTPAEIVEAIADVYAKNGGEPSGLILDLRGNPGGLLNAAVAVAAAFLPRNALVVSTKGQSADAKMRLYASKEYYIRGNKDDYMKKLPPSLSKVPMVVLGTAIQPRALRSSRRPCRTKSAPPSWAGTYGVETIQTILPLGENTR
jgi:carboxyl-terminal processing protease